MNPQTNKIIAIYKPIGTTPVELITRFKEKFPEYKDEVISYAGRLDPLAHGVMVLLVGDENKRRREHEKSDKAYEFKAILGISTDSYDICGIADKADTVKHFTLKEIEVGLSSFLGKSEQSFPPFSSYIIKGKPLFKWARDNRLNEIQIPSKQIEVFETEVLEVTSLNGTELLEEILRRINLLNGDFRQEEIIRSWEMNIDKGREYQIIRAKASVSAGTYIRGIVYDLGRKLGYKATTLEILRPISGIYGIDNALRL